MTAKTRNLHVQQTWKKKKKKERKKERRKEGKMKPGSHFFPFLKLSRVLVTVLSIAKKLVLSPF